MYHLSIPYEEKTLHFNFHIKQGSTSLGDLAARVKALNPQKVASVRFYTLDRAVIPQNELMRDRNNIPFIMEVQRDNGSIVKYSINLN